MSKLLTLSNSIVFNEITVDFLKIKQTNQSVINNSERFIYTQLSHAPVLYDLYKFMGVTSTNDPDHAIPANLYEVDEKGTTWNFILPIWGYRVPYGVNPQTQTGAGPWTFLTSINIIKTKVHFLNLPDLMVQKSKIINYLYTDNNEPLPIFVITIDPINELSTDFSTFYRWNKVTDGYELEYFSFFPYSNEVDVKLNTSIYFIDKELNTEIQSYAI